MPIVIDPNLTAPPAPVTATSPDGIVTATLDPDNAGVYLKANFGSGVLATHNFDANIANVAVYQSSATSVALTWTGSTLKSCRVDWSTGSVSGNRLGGAGILWTPGGTLATAGQRVRLTFTIDNGNGSLVADRLRVAFKGASSWQFFDLPTPSGVAGARRVTLDAIVPEGQILNGVYVYLNGNIDPNQYFLIDSLALSVSEPVSVSFTRNGTPIASGNPARTISGTSVAYDHRAPLGATSTYRATALYADGSSKVSGDVAIFTPKPTGTNDAWLKSTSNPDVSLRVLITNQEKTWTNDGRSDLSAIQGSPYRAGAYDTHLGVETSFSLLTDISVTRERMMQLLDSGVLLFQTSPDYDLPDMFVLPGAVTMTILDSGVRDRARLWSIAFTQVDEPPTAGAPLFIPGRTYNAVQALGTYDQAKIILPLYDDWIGLL